MVLPLFVATWLVPGHPGAGMSPAIGLAYTRIEGAALEELGADGLANYRKAIESNGGHAVALHAGLAPEELARRLKAIRGLLLPGGADIDPQFYGEAPHEKLGAHNAAFDLFLFDLLKEAESRGLPVLGICLGMQVINVYHGGTLYQDLPSEYRGPVAVEHKGPQCDHDPIHSVTLANPSTMHTLFGEERMPVNTRHHQAVKGLAPGFVKTAWADDGVIEAIERPGGPFYLGVQFHPERMLDAYPSVNRLFQRLLDAARAVKP